jgi:hypothetical protein
VPDARPFKPLDEHLDQGDILANAPVLKWTNGEASFAENRVVVTSNGCACEDYEREVEKGQTSAARKIMIMVAPIRNANSYPPQMQQDIKDGKFYNRFFISGDTRRLQDQVVDLTREYHVPASLLSECTKVARLADWQWKRLLIQQSVSRFHQPPEEIFLDPQPGSEDAA